MEITYKGWRVQLQAGDIKVHRFEHYDDGTTGASFLDPAASLKLRNHSPDGFQWGYGGSGPAQLALALLLDATGDKNRAQRVYQDFKDAFVARWQDQWEITQAEIIAWINAHPDLQCTPECIKAREDFANKGIPESVYMGNLCDLHFDEYLDRHKETEGVIE